MHTHKSIESLTKTVPFIGAVSRDENSAAHGGVTLRCACSCGAQRAINVNGRHSEESEWDLPEWVSEQNPHAIAYTASQARELLQALADSVAGRAAIEASCGDSAATVIERPTRGDDASSLMIARLVWREFAKRNHA